MNKNILQKRIHNLFYFIIIFCLFCCSEDSVTEPENNNNVIMPLKVGNSWTLDEGGVISEWVVSSSTIVNGEKIYELNKNVNEAGNLNTYNIGFFANRSDGLYYMKNINAILTIRFKYPGKVGDQTPNGSKITSVTKSINVPAGEFTNCYEYKANIGTNEEVVIIYKPNIGPIITLNDGELIDYSLN